MNRAQWQQIAEERLLAAKALLDAQIWSSAYYLAGYAVECGLKSCVLARIMSEPEIIFKERKFSDRCWTHDILQLVNLAGLEQVHDADRNASPSLDANWLVVEKWEEQARYQFKKQAEAEGLYTAITHPIDGVMQWIRARW
ncbi:MAG: HEPN domain-containing protein [Planctomycetes bacterium]|nr:HEPN domain-containing protein [Planctomycetota bacterium]